MSGARARPALRRTARPRRLRAPVDYRAAVVWLGLRDRSQYARPSKLPIVVTESSTE